MIAHIKSNQEIETVWEHSVKTAIQAKKLGKSCKLEHIAELAAILHDMGKATEAFAHYISCVSDGQEWKKAKLNHSSAGAKWICENYPGENRAERLTTQIVAWAIMSHHGIQDVVSLDGTDCYARRISPEQEIYYEEAVRNYMADCIEDLNYLYQQAVSDVEAIMNKMRGRSKETIHFCLGIQMRIVLSLLIDSDRIETARYMGSVIKEKGDSQAVWNAMILKIDEKAQQFQKAVVEDIRQQELYRIRNQISQQCLKKSDLPVGIYTLQVPTGGGKSLASMRFALHHAQHHHMERIFYIAPFRTILEQTAKTYRELFQMDDMILEHHSDIIVEKDDEETQAWIERWASPVILTTFVQFLNTLFGKRTQNIRRMHMLANAVIIVDEVQSLPIKMVSLFNQAMNALCKMNTTIVLCSATQPLLDKLEKNTLQIDGNLIDHAEALFQKMKRTEIVDCTMIKHVEGISAFACEKILELPCGLIVLNTRSAAKKVYEALQEKNMPNTTLIYLSTYMCAKHRMDQLEEYRRLLEESRIPRNKQRVICVSTQLIEAGVDLSADWVIRSIAGWDSVIQAAGRCNREASRELGYVYLVKCEEEKLGSLEDIRDGKMSSERLLREHERFAQEEESLDSLQTIDRYYQYYFWEKKNQMDYPVAEGSLRTSIWEMLSMNCCGVMNWRDKAQKEGWENHLLNQAFRSAGEHFKVIDADTQAILVPYGEGKRYIEQLNSELSYGDMEDILRKAQRYTVNAREGEIKRYLEKGIIYRLHACEAYALRAEYYQESGITEKAELETLFL